VAQNQVRIFMKALEGFQNAKGEQEKVTTSSNLKSVSCQHRLQQSVCATMLKTLQHMDG
jgi:hypothetical protein